MAYPQANQATRNITAEDTASALVTELRTQIDHVAKSIEEMEQKLKPALGANMHPPIMHDDKAEISLAPALNEALFEMLSNIQRLGGRVESIITRISL